MGYASVQSFSVGGFGVHSAFDIALFVSERVPCSPDEVMLSFY